MTYANTMYARGLPSFRVACIRNGDLGIDALLSGYLKIRFNARRPPSSRCT